MNEKYSKRSAILSIISAITMFIAYEFAPDKPEGMMVVFLKVLFFSSIITGVLSLVFSYISFKNKEEGFLKKVAPFIILLILLVFSFSIIGVVIGLM
ncbi:hypothetical protein J7E52_12980 [Bacillus sp. ISL-34]|uniref:hypothetical protein n=1 Tax=Bacillus sp. ISL-34 TaxID=2819121 RepID=UPI001BECE07C|nr:hypothetical protein [Bacillus sp. ISL-34]MBT2647632.1 hypothetical protein [Bacillus sp. ISL-34]